VTEPLRASDPAAATAILQRHETHPDLPDQFRPFLQALQAIAAGSRDRALAEAPEFNYRMAAEVLLVIEKLGNAGRRPGISALCLRVRTALPTLQSRTRYWGCSDLR
jgi:hypothetical protein